jgi:hypothetical protein
MTSKERKAEIKEIYRKLGEYPQIALITTKIRCEAYKYSRMPLKAYADPVLHATYQCKRNARLHFEAYALPKNSREYPAISGNFCCQHFSNNLYACDTEAKRFALWWAKIVTPEETSE